MGGILNIGGSSAKTDRGNQLAATSGLWNVFNYGLTGGQQQESAAQRTIGQAGDYFNRLLRAGRTDTALMAAPAVNARFGQADAARRQEAAMGTGRTGGSVEANREAGSKAQSDVADIINQNLVGGRQAGAQGLERIAGTEFTNAGNLLGLGTGAVTDILGNATQSRALSQQIHDQAAAGYGHALGQVLSLAMGF